MVQRIRFKRFALTCVWLLLIGIGLSDSAIAQTATIYADLAHLEGSDLRPDNVLGYQLTNRSGSTVNVRIKGTLSFKSKPMYLKYELIRLLRPGSHSLDESDKRQIVWTTNEPALKELFLSHSRLPQGTVEYCVEVQPMSNGSEQGIPEGESNCIYYTQDDLFSINLADPEDKATLYDKYPVFSWVVNYPFASALTYRIRIAEQKPGQNPANAIARNNPMWQDKNISATTAIYPLTGKPLEYGQPYVWTVDAYYKGLLLGGAETWRFIIVEDSILKGLPKEVHFLDIREEKGSVGTYAIDSLKLKYNLREFKADELKYTIFDKNKTMLGKGNMSIPIIMGDNRISIDLNEYHLRHSQKYSIEVIDGSHNLYKVFFVFLNSDFI